MTYFAFFINILQYIITNYNHTFFMVFIKNTRLMYYIHDIILITYIEIILH